MLFDFFKGIIDEDLMPIVICNLNNEIIYLNPTAVKRYEKYGGNELLGKSILNCHNKNSEKIILETVENFKQNKELNRVFTYHNKENSDVYMVALRNESGELLGYYEKHESRNLEKR